MVESDESSLRIISEKSYSTSFKAEFIESFQQADAKKVALLPTCEYEGIFRNGGVGTYYRTLSEKLTENGWHVILLVCNTTEEFGGKSHLAAVKHIFSTHEIKKVLNLQATHLAILSSVESTFFDLEGFRCLFFTQAVVGAFKGCSIYVEFHEMAGIGYRTLQAKQCHFLPENCVIGVTIHSGHEWIYEANNWYAEEYSDGFSQVCDYEQKSFETADVAFFPSHYLKSKVTAYGWKTDHAEHLPYFIPSIDTEALLNQSITSAIDSERLLQIPGMTTLQERAYLQNYAEREYLGKGQIVELGCWLGSLTVPLAIGVERNPQIDGQQPCIHAYDLFEWASWMEGFVGNTSLQERYKPSDSFLDAFLEQIQPWKEQVAVYPGDLTQMRWDQEMPIEYLLVDAMKSWELTNSIIQNFFSALVPELSRVHHQDFAHHYTPWIHLIMYRFKDYFEPVCYVPSGSFIFEYKEMIPAKLLETTYSFADFAETEVDAAFDYAFSIVPAKAKPFIAAAKTMLYVHLNQPEAAIAQLQLAQAQGLYLEEAGFGKIKRRLETEYSWSSD